MGKTGFGRGFALLALAAPWGCGARTFVADLGGVGGAGGQSQGQGGRRALAAQSSAAVVGPGAGGAGGGGADMGVDLIISQGGISVVESEVDLEVNPAGRVAAAWIAADVQGSSFIGCAFSDGGSNWTEPTKVDTPDGKQASDPVLTSDAGGSFWLTWIGFGYDPMGNPIDLTVYLAQAGPNDDHFGPAIEVEPPANNDKPWIARTPAGALLITWIELGPTEWAVHAARTADGKSFDRSVVVAAQDGLEGYQFARPCASPGNPRVLLSYLKYQQDKPSPFLTYSDDDGRSWRPGGGIQLGKQPNVAATDTACAADGSQVWVLYGLSSDDPNNNSVNPALTSVLVAHSSDSGNSSDATFTMSDGTNQPILDPQLIAAADGLHLGYYRGAQIDGPGEFVDLAADRETGKMIASRTLHQPIDFQQQRASVAWLGDYTGLRRRGGKLFAAFADNDSGSSHIRFVRGP